MLATEKTVRTTAKTTKQSKWRRVESSPAWGCPEENALDLKRSAEGLGKFFMLEEVLKVGGAEMVAAAGIGLDGLPS